MEFKHIHIDETDSTNRWLWENGDGVMLVTTDYQTAGKGQGSHTWESERGKNLLFSIMLHPTWLKPSRQFLLLEAWALSLIDVLREFLDETEGICTQNNPADITIKWPNDIYWRDKKISGTLIETRLSGSTLKDAVIGTGININQQQFLSDAPNPISLCHLCGSSEPIDKQQLLSRIINKFTAYYQQLMDGDEEAIQELYHQSLYRRHGFHTYKDANGIFEAELIGVSPSGLLTLRTQEGENRQYEQRTVQFVIK